MSTRMNKTPYLSETKDDCHYYNYGGDLDFPDRPPYPKLYGARCEFYKKFFFSKRQWAGGKHEGLRPNCGRCREYIVIQLSLRTMSTKKINKNKTCEKCKLLSELYEGTPKSNRDYWIMTELFVLLHGSDECKGGKNEYS